MQHLTATPRSNSQKLLRGTAVLALACGLIASPGLGELKGQLTFGDGAAMAAPGGNGNGNGNAGGGNRGGGPGNVGATADGQGNGLSTAPGQQKNRSSSNATASNALDSDTADDEEESTLRDSIKAMADELGGRLNALNSAINGNTENAAPHSAAGLAHSATQAMAEGDSDQLGEDLGNLSNAKEAPESVEGEEDSLANAIDDLTSDFNDLFGIDDEAPTIDSDEAATKTRATIDGKDGVGLGAVKEAAEADGESEEESTASTEQEDDDDEEQL